MSKFSTLFKGVQANDAAITTEMCESGSSRVAAESKLISEGRLTLNDSAQDAWQEHIELNPRQNHQAGFLAWAAEYVESEDARELAALQHQFPNVEPNLDSLREEQARYELMDEICDLLRAKDPSGRGGKYSNFNLQAARRQMIEGRWSREKLIARRDEIVREQALIKKPMAELKAMVKEHYNQPIQFPGFPALPDRMYDQATRSWKVVDAAYLEDLIRADVFSFRRLVRLYSAAQIDARRGLAVK